MTHTPIRPRTWASPAAHFTKRGGDVNPWTRPEEKWRSPANDAIIDEIKAFAKLPNDWDSYGAEAPDEQVIRCACGAVIGLDQKKITVLRATPGAGNNIELTFSYKNASVVIDMDDEEWQVRVQHRGQAPTYHKILPSEAINVHAVLDLV